MITWSPDTCICAFEVTEDFQYVSSISRCKLHNAQGPEHLEEVMLHNKTFNNLTQYIQDPEDTEDILIRRCLDAKARERERSGS